MQFNSVQLTSHITSSPRNSLPNVGEVTELEKTCRWHSSPVRHIPNKSATSRESGRLSNVTIIQNENASLNQTDNKENAEEKNELKKKSNDVKYDFEYLQHASLVRFETRDGNAKSNKDYTQTSGTLVRQHPISSSIFVKCVYNCSTRP